MSNHPSIQPPPIRTIIAIALIGITAVLLLGAVAPSHSHIAVRAPSLALLAMLALGIAWWWTSRWQRQGPSDMAPHDARAQSPMWLLVASVCVLGGILTTWVAIELMDSATRESTRQFTRRAQNLARDIRQRARKPAEGLRWVRGAHDAGQMFLSQQLAAVFASHDLAREFPGVAGFGCVRRLEGEAPAGEPPAAASDSLIRSGKQWRVLSAYPAQVMERWGAVNVEADPAFCAAIAAAKQIGDLVVAPFPPPSSARAARPELLYLLPVYRTGVAPPGSFDRRASIDGFVFATVTMADALKGVAEGSDELLDYRLFDAGADSATSTVVAESETLTGATDPSGPVQRVGTGDPFSSEAFFRIGGRPFRLVTTATPVWRVRAAVGVPYAALGIGAALTAVTAVLVASVSAAYRRRVNSPESQAAILQLEEIQRVARIGTWRLDLSKRQLTWSTEIYRLFNCAVVGSPPSYEEMLTFYAADAAALLDQTIQGAVSHGSDYDLVLRTNDRNPEVRYVRARGMAERDDGRTIVALFGTVSDCTAEVERTQALRQAQMKAEAANRAKSAFLANMSHEIRTPLTAILGFADTLYEEGNLAHAPPHRIQAIASIRNAGEHLLTVINDILDISKIEAQKLKVERIDMCPLDVAREVESIMRHRAALKGVAFSARLATPVPLHIFSDPTRLRQILVNLVGNAVKFTETGTVTMTLGVEEASGRQMFVVDVEDSGNGMTSDQAAQLFQPFGQADASVTRKYGGTGLGLTICRRLSGLMGGRVTLVRTAPGVGSCFRLALPLEPVPGTGTAESIETNEGFRASAVEVVVRLAGRILLAEDGEDNQRLIAFHLRKAGAEVDVAANGRIALDMIAQSELANRPYELLLTDMQMPELDGYSLARTLRGQGSGLPVVALTAHAMSEDREHCISAGCDDYLAKPIDRRALLTVCQRWLGRSGGANASQGNVNKAA